ncbi:MAG: pyridoxamine 5'-phosphate oxidase family protein, partial [Pseudomonadales bacterium]|nr:pyridoxamine 5'-phosphate oxidase family protein [Pseudomonadales bacterium]
MNPMDKIRSDRVQARKLDDPNADICYLALATSGGEPSLRTMVLRSINENRFGVFLNKTSPKWQMLSNEAKYQLLLWYPSMQRQYRIWGDVQTLDDEVVRSNWHRRPLGSKYLDYAYETLGAQSSFIDSREVLVEAINEIRETWRGKDMQPPEMVAGVALVAKTIDMRALN